MPDDPVVRAVDDLVTPESVEGGSLRAVEAALVVGQMAAALGPEHGYALPLSDGCRSPGGRPPLKVGPSTHRGNVTSAAGSV
ncbi:MAG: hypothetical protein M3387_04585 [Actinomycetota bacterium]|nr:hypothetical protein [Actinomycetota bacterium]